MTWNKHQWCLAATDLTAGHGGIARVARLCGKSLIETGANTKLLALGDADTVRIAEQASVTAKKSRLKFTALCHAAALRHDRFLYDLIGPARAHPKMPGFSRPYGIWIHGIEVWKPLEAKRLNVLKNAEFILVNSEYTLKRFQELHGHFEQAHVCLLATEEDDPLPARETRNGPPTVLLVGRTDAESFHKGHTEMVLAWENVVKSVPDARLLLAGGGTALDHLKDLVKVSPVRENIEVLGFVPEAQMPELWARADIFALPSWQEGFGLVYIEAMRQGIPVIASRHDAGQEVNKDQVTGYNVSLEGPEELPARLVQLLGDRDLVSKMGLAGQERWYNHFRYSAFKKRFTNILEKVEAGRTGA